VVDPLLQGVLDMEESTTYQAILRKGTTEGVAQLEELLLRLGQVPSWDELLRALPGQRRRRPPRRGRTSAAE
jgi:hypothetical protein